MTCHEVERLIIAYAQGGAIPPEAAAHIAGCKSCTSLAMAFAPTDPPPAPSSEQLQQIKSGIVATLKPVQPLAPTRVFVSALILIAVFAAAAGVLELGTAGWHALSPLQATAVFTALAVSLFVLSFSLARQIIPGSRLLLPPHLSVLGFVAIVGAIFGTMYQAHSEPAFISTGLMCLRIGLECAVPVAALCWLVLRRGAILNPKALGLLIGALAGLSGLLLLEIFCPNLNAYHVLAWHLGVVLASTLGGMAAGFIVEHFRQ